MKVYLLDREWYPVDLPEEFINEYIETKVKMENMLAKIETYIGSQGGADYGKE